MKLRQQVGDTYTYAQPMSFWCHKFSSMNLYTFPISSEQEFIPLQLRSQNLILKNLKAPSGNRMGSKYCALAINCIWNFNFAAYICCQPNETSVFCFVDQDIMLQAIRYGYRDQINSSKFDYFRQLNSVPFFLPGESDPKSSKK